MPPPTKKSKTSQAKKKLIPNDAQWCLDKGDSLTFKEYIAHYDCLDRNQAQQQFGKILGDYYNPKSDLHNKIRAEYKTWTSSADYIRFWQNRADSIILLKTGLGSTELINKVTDKRMESLQSCAIKTRSQTAASLPSELPSSNNDEDPSSSTGSTPTAIPGSPTVSATSCGPNEPITLTNLTLHGIHNHLTNIRKSFINEEQINNESYIFKDVNISRLFNKYQNAVSNIIEKHKCLPIESYVHELASLTHIFFLCENQHSEIAEKIFTLDLLKELASTPEIEAANANLRFPMDDFMTINTAINNLSSEKVGREIITIDVLTLAARMNYGPKRLLMGTTNLINKLPNTPLNDYKKLSETELWSTYFDPMLSSLISDPERLIHLRWTDTIPNENGNSRPDSVISEKKQLAFGSSLGFGEAKIQQGSCSKLSCLDTLRLAIFTKNAIDVHKLDGALAFQIHGFNVTFYLNQVVAKGIYTFKEIAHVRFPQSLEDLPSFFTLINIEKLLMVNHIFWNTCKKSQHPDVIHSRYKETQMSLDAIIDSSQDSTRQCVLRFGH